MIELAKEEKNIVFLTNDTEKEDWVDRHSKKTFESYQIMFYVVTGQAFKVVKYNDFLKDSIGIDPLTMPTIEENNDTDSLLD